MEPAYRDGDVIIVSPAAPVRRGDRVVVKTKNGEVMVKELKRQTAKTGRAEIAQCRPSRAHAVASTTWCGSRASSGRASSPAGPDRRPRYAERASAPSIMSTVFFNAVDRDERAEARAFLLPEQHLIEHVEPVERHAGLAVLGLLLLVEERLAPADLVDHVLDLLRRRSPRGSCDSASRRSIKASRSTSRRLAEFLFRQHEVAEIMDGVSDQRVELRMRLRRHARPVAADEAPQRLGVLRIRGRHQRQQHRERDRHVGLRRIAGMDVPDRIGQPLLAVLPLYSRRGTADTRRHCAG